MCMFLVLKKATSSVPFMPSPFCLETPFPALRQQKTLLYICKSIYCFPLPSHLEVTSVCLRQECSFSFPWVCGPLSWLCTLDFYPHFWSVGSLCTVTSTSAPLDSCSVLLDPSLGQHHTGRYYKLPYPGNPQISLLAITALSWLKGH